MPCVFHAARRPGKPHFLGWSLWDPVGVSYLWQTVWHSPVPRDHPARISGALGSLMWCVYNQVQNTQGHGYTAWTGRHRLLPPQQNGTPAFRRRADEKRDRQCGRDGPW